MRTEQLRLEFYKRVFGVQLSPKHLKNLDAVTARYMAATVAAAAESRATNIHPGLIE